MKKHGIIIGIVVFVVILIVICVMLNKSIKKDQEETKKKMEEVTDEYNSFTQNITLFNEKREELAEVLGNDQIYYANLYKNSNLIQEKIKSCEEVVTKIQNKNETITKLCEKYYPDNDINDKCDNYKKTYQKVNEILKKDVDNYNQMVDKYNEWTKTNPKYKTIEKYKLEDVNNG